MEKVTHLAKQAHIEDIGKYNIKLTMKESFILEHCQKDENDTIHVAFYDNDTKEYVTLEDAGENIELGIIGETSIQFEYQKGLSFCISEKDYEKFGKHFETDKPLISKVVNRIRDKAIREIEFYSSKDFIDTVMLSLASLVSVEFSHEDLPAIKLSYKTVTESLDTVILNEKIIARMCRNYYSTSKKSNYGFVKLINEHEIFKSNNIVAGYSFKTDEFVFKLIQR